jgi:hypothetical protein
LVKNPLAFPAYILALLALAAGCGKPSPPGRLENVGGSSAAEPDASTGGTSGNGGDGGGGGEPALDAGANVPDAQDAGADVELPDAGDAGDADAATDAGPGVTPCDDGWSGPGNGAGPPEECIYIHD